MGGAFRYCLIAANTRRDALITFARAWPYVGWLAPVALGLVGAALARFLVVRFAPIAEGSGVQRVEAAYRGEVKPRGTAMGQISSRVAQRDFAKRFERGTRWRGSYSAR